MAEPTFHEIMQWSVQEARDYLERMRWPDGPACPNGCASEVYRVEARTRRNGKVQPTRYLLKCKQCKRQFTATVGTIFEDSKVPLNKWLAAIYLMCTSKKGISAHQLHRMIGVQYRTAWYMCHRVRHAIKDKGGLLTATIEVDETYVGGKPRGHPRQRAARLSMSERIKEARPKKTPVFGAGASGPSSCQGSARRASSGHYSRT
jgi:transposase-like protein